MEKIDPPISQGIVDNDLFGDSLAIVFQDDQSGAKLSRGTRIVKADVKVVAAHLKPERQRGIAVTQRDTIDAASLRDSNEPVESENRSDHGSDQNEHDAHMYNRHPDASPAPFFRRNANTSLALFDMASAKEPTNMVLVSR
ncbi:MAG: hypothetical protein U5R30_20850 [Deltaproteobacteria bacterium]|nr:hypothetical protein [Deltaproteobacteria bacterium]